MNRKEIKQRAKEFAFNNKMDIWEPYLIIIFISFLFSLILKIIGIEAESLLGIILTLGFDFVLLPVSIGYTHYLIKLVNGEKLSIQECLFSKYNIFGLIFIVMIHIAIFTTLWALLFIIPGIIYSFKMAMTGFLLADNASVNTNYREVIDTSIEMMDGYKKDYFVFSLSFIGWILLTIVTLGIAIIWVYPYITVAEVMYYQELKKIKNIK